MSKFADLDRARAEHILVNQHSLLLAITALERITKRSSASWAEEIAKKANEHVDNVNEQQIAAVMAQLDSQYD